MPNYPNNTFTNSSYSPSGYSINRPRKRRGPGSATSSLVWEDNLLVAQLRPDSTKDVVSVGSVYPTSPTFHSNMPSLYGNWTESWDNTLP